MFNPTKRFDSTRTEPNGSAEALVASRYAAALFKGPSATLDDVRKAVTTLEETEQTARRMFGGAHPFTKGIGDYLKNARRALRAREKSREAPPTTA